MVEGRLPDAIEVAAYYVIAESITNAAKHAEAIADPRARRRADDTLALSRRRRRPAAGPRCDGSGLVGLRDRVEALRGRLRVMQSPPGAGTTVSAELPLTG